MIVHARASFRGRVRNRTMVTTGQMNSMAYAKVFGMKCVCRFRGARYQRRWLQIICFQSYVVWGFGKTFVFNLN